MPTFDEIREHRDKTNPFALYVGIKTLELRDGYARNIMTISPEFENTHGTIHGGAIFTLADTCAGAAAASGGFGQTTVNCLMNYLRPVHQEKVLYAESKRVKGGRTLSVFDVTITNSSGTVMATGTFTYFNLNTPLFPEKG